MEERGERLVHDGGVAGMRGLEARHRIATPKPEAARERGERRPVGRHAVRLPLVDDLELVLDVAQEAVRVAERRSRLGGDVAAGRQPRQRTERAALLDARVLAAVDELLRLDDELDLADTAAAELHVAGARRRIAQRGVDPLLHRLEVLDGAEVEVAPVDEGVELGEERQAEVAIAADRPGLQPHGALPHLAEGLVVRDRRGERHRERPLSAAGAEAEVDPEAEPVGRHVAQGPRHLLAETREELAVRAAARVGAVALVDVHEVDVGAVVELAAAELAHAEDDESPRPLAGPVVAPLGRETRARRVRRGVDDRLGERGELAHRLLDRRETEEIAPADPEELAAPVAAQPGMQLDTRQRPRHPGGLERRAMGGGVAARDVEHGVEERRPPAALGHERRRQRRAAAEETEERRHETARRRARRRLDEARERRQGIGRVGRGVESRTYLVRGRGVDPRARGACLQPGEQSCGIRHGGARKSTGTPAASSRSRRYPWRTPWSLTVTAFARAAATTRSRTTAPAGRIAARPGSRPASDATAAGGNVARRATRAARASRPSR